MHWVDCNGLAPLTRRSGTHENRTPRAEGPAGTLIVPQVERERWSLKQAGSHNCSTLAKYPISPRVRLGIPFGRIEDPIVFSLISQRSRTGSGPRFEQTHICKMKAPSSARGSLHVVIGIWRHVSPNLSQGPK